MSQVIRSCFSFASLYRLYQVSCSEYIQHPLDLEQWHSAAAIKHVQGIKAGIYRGQPPLNVDIVSILQELVGSIPIETKLDWVRSHQDTSSGTEQLSVQAKLNVRADGLAARYLFTYPRGQPGCTLQIHRIFHKWEPKGNSIIHSTTFHEVLPDQNTFHSSQQNNVCK